MSRAYWWTTALPWLVRWTPCARLGSAFRNISSQALAGDEQAGDSGTGPIDWPALVERFKARKLSSGAIKPQTWSSLYERRIVELLAVFEGKRPPTNPRELLEAVTARWAKQPGARGRQIQVQQTAALLRWGVDSGTLAPE